MVRLRGGRTGCRKFQTLRPLRFEECDCDGCVTVGACVREDEHFQEYLLARCVPWVSLYSTYSLS